VPRAGAILRYTVVGIALLLTGYNGLIEGINATHVADTPGMKVATATQLLYGFAAVAAIAAIFVRRRLVFPILVGWGIALVLTGALAPVVYGGSSLGVGLAGGAVTAVLVALVLRAWPARGPGGAGSGNGPAIQ
ncbi:MAG TPA: hypothetical protein VGQ17_10610, partial [Gemmatimonadales bacterium]|nr:hypothetical protein [Gemmatimonadales bacterium]